MTGSNGAAGFPDGFAWGAATAAYQIEGAASTDGQGPSVWDTFSHTPGNIRGGDTGDIACDSYHRYREDVALMAALGLNAYRFSIAWPRVQPAGRGAGQPARARLLPRAARRAARPRHRAGGHALPLGPAAAARGRGRLGNRDTAQRFADYAAIVRAGPRRPACPLDHDNEPQVVANHGYRIGTHAPGLHRRRARGRRHASPAARSRPGHAGAARDAAGAAEVGITLDLHPVRALGDGRPGEVEEARLITDAELNRIFLDPVLHGRYPAHAPGAILLPPRRLVRRRHGADQPRRSTSSGSTTTPRSSCAPATRRTCGATRSRRAAGCPAWSSTSRRSCRGPRWAGSSTPTGCTTSCTRLSESAPGLPLYITENGCAAEDYVNPEGEVDDLERVGYLHAHLEAAARAIRDGVSLAGYFVWSLLDNFEWAWGYQKRFGIVFVDFGTQRRIPKPSARFYSGVVRANAVPPRPAAGPRAALGNLG